MRVKCLAQEHNAMTWPGIEPGPFDTESSALTARPPRLPLQSYGSLNRFHWPRRASKGLVINVVFLTHLCGYHFVLGLSRSVVNV